MTFPVSVRFRQWLPLALPLAVALLLRLFLVAHSERIGGDTLVYGDIARNWMQHGVYGFTWTVQGHPAVPRPTLIRLPGYPIFLAVCFFLFGIERYLAVVLVQVAVDLVTCLLVAALARRLFGPRAGLAALWLACLCPFTASYAAAPLTETLSLFCIALALYTLERWRSAGANLNRWLVGLGFSLAYAVLLRPEQGMLAVAIIPAMLWMVVPTPGRRFRSLLPVLLTALLTVAPLLPWTIRNERTFKVLQPLAPRFANDPGEDVPYGFQRWFRTWAIDFASTEEVYWNYDGVPIEISNLPNRAFDSNAQYASTEALLREYNETSNATPVLDRRFDAIADERIHADPLRYYLFLPVARVLNMALRPRTETMATPLEWWNFHRWPRQTVFATLFAAINLGYLVAGGLGFYGWKKHLRPADRALFFAMAGIILLRCVLLLTLDNSEPRYTLEFFPILILTASTLWRGHRSEDQAQATP